MLKKVLIGVAAVLVLALIVVAVQPSQFKVERSVVIAASPAVVGAQISDFHNWANWSPWEKMDPSMKKTFEGANDGMGAVYSWEGNKKVGAGKMTIVEYQPASLIRIKLDFTKPFAASHMTDFVLTSEAEGTKVTWTMTGKKNFMAKAAGMFMNMDKMVGGDFEKGLTQLKSVSEGQAQQKQPMEQAKTEQTAQKTQKTTAKAK